MPITQDVFNKVSQFEQDGYSHEEILTGLEASGKYPDIAKKAKDFANQGYSPSEIIQGMKASYAPRTTIGKIADIVTPVPALAAANILEAGAGIADIAGYGEKAKRWREDVGVVRKQVQEELPVEPESWSEAGRGALTSIYGQVPAIAAGVVTGGATLPLTALGTQAGLQKVSELTEGGMPKATAITGGAVSGLAEAFTEKIPFDTLFKKSGLTLGKKLVKLFISEQIGEQGATAVNAAIDKVTIRPDMTMDDYIRDVKATAKATLIQTGLMSPLTALDTRKPEVALPSKVAPPAGITPPVTPPPGPLTKAGQLIESLGIGAMPSPEEVATREAGAEAFTRARGLEPMVPSIADLGLKGFGYGEVTPEPRAVAVPPVKPRIAGIEDIGGEIYAGPEAEAAPVFKKEEWEQPFTDFLRGNYQWKNTLGNKQGEVKRKLKIFHEDYVKQTLNKGKTPYEGWEKDYPELAKTPTVAEKKEEIVPPVAKVEEVKPVAPAVAKKPVTPPVEKPAPDLEAVKSLIPTYTDGTLDVMRLAGPKNLKTRMKIMSMLKGEKVISTKSTLSLLQAELAKVGMEKGKAPAEKVEVFNFMDDVKSKHPDLTDEDISYIARETAAQFEQVAARSKGQAKGIAEDAVKAWNSFAETGKLPIAKKGQFKDQPKTFGSDEFDKQVAAYKKIKTKAAKTPEEVEGIDLSVGDSFTVKGETHNVLSETEDGKLKIQNGTTQYVWPDETVEIDKGSLKKAVKKEAPTKGKDQEMFAGVNKVPTAGLKTGKPQAEDLLEGFRKPEEDKQAGLFAPSNKESLAVGEEAVKEPGVIEDFGEKIEGARKDLVAAMRKEYSDEDLATLPLSKIWPSDLSDKIEDPYIAAIAFAAREEIPSKPRQPYKVKRWVEKVKVVRSLAEKMLSSTMVRAKAEAALNEYKGLEGFAAKVSLLESIDRNQWGRIGKVGVHPNAFKYDEAGKRVPSSFVSVQVDGNSQIFQDATSVADVIEKVNEKLGVERQAAKMKFEVRGREGAYFINKAGDREYRKLKTFETGKEALDYRNTNYKDLVAEWEAVKERDNVKQTDVRRGENRPRTAEDYRKGKDLTVEQFGSTFGFRGGQFGKWVSQGSNAKERQWMINNAYDALMDLSTILNVPPKAISLNGELGIAFGARGSGAASAHYESDQIVINLTKTRGAGTLAHEWFHALDNYFQRKRGVTGAEREGRFVTYLPEAMLVRKDGQGSPISKERLKAMHKNRPDVAIYNQQYWQPDPNHPKGVRPEVEARFAELVEALNESPMTKRSAIIDAGKSDGYWSKIIERAARSFENYIIAKMAEKGYNNDYLANVANVNEFKRDMGRYPYLKEEELAPVIEAFDNLFGEMKTTETPKGISLGSGLGALQDSYEALEKVTVAKIKDAIPHLEAIGNSIYSKGMKYAEFAKSMKIALGNLWEKFRSQMIRVFQSVKKYVKEIQPGMSIRDVSTKPIEEAMKPIEEAKPFYSQLERVIESKVQSAPNKKVDPDTFKGVLSTPGIKQDEIANTKIKDFLEGKKAVGKKVSKNDVLDYLKEQRTEFEDVMLGEDLLLLDSESQKRYNLPYDELTMVEQAMIREDVMGDIFQLPKETQFSSYQEPGSVPGSYREMFVTAPESSESLITKKEIEEMNNLQSELSKPPQYSDEYKSLSRDLGVMSWGEPGLEEKQRRFKELHTKEIAGESDKAERLEFLKEKFNEPPGWQDGHPQYKDIQNPVIRVRFNERTDDSGRKILFIEEMQPPSKGNQAKMPEWLQKRQYDIGVKRILKYAADNGFDGISWTPGSIQASRYDLSKQVEKISYNKTGHKGPEGSIYLNVQPKGREAEKLYLTSEELEANVGKDIANKILSGGDYGTFSDLDLRVGGTGLKSLYDKILPNKFQEITKGKVGETDINDGAMTVPFIPVPKEAAGGFALYQRGKEKGAGLKISQIESAVNPVLKAWKNAPKVNIIQSLSEIPRHLQARMKKETGELGAIEGMFDPKTKAVYLVADNISSGNRALEVLLHESFGHFGLRGMMGERIKPLLNTVWREKNAEARAIAKEYELNITAEGVEGYNARQTAAEEVLARMAQEAETPPLLKRVMAAIRNWMRRVGLDIQLTDNDLKKIIYDAAQFVRTGEKSLSLTGMVEYSQRTAQTETPEFKEWFKGSKVIDKEGKPLVVFHGTEKAGFASFDYDKGSFARGKETYGYHFTEDRRTAATYSGSREEAEIVESEDFDPRYEGEEGIYSVYLKMKNPFEIDFADESGEPQGWDTEVDGFFGVDDVAKFAKDNGYDGVIVRNVIDEGPHGQGYGWGNETYIVFEPTQIKSVFNVGAFDPTDPNILLSRSVGKIIGQSGRTYTEGQRKSFRNIGREIEIPTVKERMAALWKDAGKKISQGLVDQFAPVKEISEEAYRLLRQSKGASGAFQVLLHGGRLKLTDKTYDFDETKRGGVVDRLLVPLQGEADDFLWWVAGNRAESLSEQDRENLFTKEDMAAVKTLAEGDAPFKYTLQHGTKAGTVTHNRREIYQDALRTLNQFNKNILDMAEQSHLIDPESRKVWESEFYVPFYRVNEDDESGVRGMNVKSGVIRQQAFKRLRGGTGKLNSDLLENTLMNWAHLIDASAKNRAAEASITAAEKMGVARKAEYGEKKAVWYMGKISHIIPKGQEYTDDGVTKVSDGTAVVENIGKVEYIVDDPYVMTAISSLEYAGMRSPVMDAMSTMKHALTIGVTASPFFKIRNLIRDSIQSVAVSPLGPNIAANIKRGWKLTDRKSDNYFRLLAGGGTIHFGTMLEGNESKRVRSLIKAGVNEGTILDDESKLKNFYRKKIEPAITAYNELGNKGEAINRASLYDQLIKQGMGHGEASLMARDLMDFSMGGAWTSVRFLTQIVPFMNARMQGLYKLGRASKNDPAKVGAVLGATALFSISLMLAYSDDDDWKKREEWDRDNYWWFKLGGTAYRIPKPFEIGAIATLAERGVELFASEEMTGERFRKRLYAVLSDNLSMNPVPQLVKPILDIYANKDSFTGRPIETMGMERVASQYRFTPRTSMAARAASTASMGAASPVQIDHMIRGYFGWLGTFVVGISDTIAKPATGQVKRATPDYWKFATGGIVSGLSSAPSRYVSQMYEQAKVIEEAYGTWKHLIKEGKREEAEAFAAKHKEAIGKYRLVGAMKSRMTDINNSIRKIERSDMPPDEKRNRIQNLQKRKDAIARKIVARKE